MVQDQLLDYISSQMKLGIARDTIKAALLGAGWAAGDVEDSLKKAESAMGAKPAAPAQPAAASVKVSDLVSASGSATSFSTNVSPVSMAAKPAAVAAVKPAVAPATMQKESPMNLGKPKMADPMPASMPATIGGGMMGMKKKFPIMTIVYIVLIVAFGGLAGYFFMQNNSLSAQVASLGGASATVTSQLGGLQAQVQQLNASNTAYSAEITSLTGENAMLKANLSFAPIPLAGIKPTSTETVSISGALSSSKGNYLLVTAYGVSVYVQNSKDAKVTAALQPLLASTVPVTLTGTHVTGSQYLTVTAVNGSSLEAPAAASSTPTSTASSTPTP